MRLKATLLLHGLRAHGLRYHPWRSDLPAWRLATERHIELFSFEDPVVVLRVKGGALLAALENSISLAPASKVDSRKCQTSSSNMIHICPLARAYCGPELATNLLT